MGPGARRAVGNVADVAGLSVPIDRPETTLDRYGRRYNVAVAIELYAKDSRIAFLTDGTQIPVSRSGYARLRELL